VLFRNATQDGRPVKQLVVPTAHRATAINGVHRDAGHPGKDKALWLARQRFFWPGMETDIEKRVTGCLNCGCRKTPTKPMTALLPIKTYRPMQLVCIDFLKGIRKAEKN